MIYPFTRKLIYLFFLFTVISCSADEFSQNQISDFDYLRDFQPRTENGLVNAVIEISAGELEKWEVRKDNGYIEWEMIGDSMRVIDYLPYPANYGMIPQTRLPIEAGGDDDPLDVIVLGPKIERGVVQPVRIIGVIKMLDRGEQDDKLLALDPNTNFGSIYNIEDLQISYPGVLEIITTWFEFYKGPGLVEIQSIENLDTANQILQKAIEAYQIDPF